MTHPTEMQAIVCSKPQDDLVTTGLAEVAVPTPGPDEILVKVGAASLNPVDWKLCAGIAPWWDKPMIVGLDAAGTVAATGADVRVIKQGDRVMWHGNLNRDGVFADYAVTPARVVSRIPDTVDFSAAAALPCAGLTAYQALVRKMRLQPGETLIVQGASGGVGGFALQIARNIGVHTIALARPDHWDHAKSLGADHCVDYRSEDLKEKVASLTDGLGADAMLEVVNSGDARTSLDLLRYNGQLATIDPLPDLTNVPPYTYAASLHEVALGGAYGAGDLRTQADFAAMGDQLLSWLAEGKLDPMISRRIKMAHVPEALKDLRNRSFVGKAVIEM